MSELEKIADAIYELARSVDKLAMEVREKKLDVDFVNATIDTDDIADALEKLASEVKPDHPLQDGLTKIADAIIEAKDSRE